MSFRLKTVLGIALIEIVMLAVLVALNITHLRRSGEAELTERARTSAALLSTMLADPVIAFDLATVDSLLEHAVENKDLVFVRVVDGNNRVLAQVGDPQAIAARFFSDGDASAERAKRLDVTSPIRVGDVTYGVVQIGLATSGLEAVEVEALRWSLVVAGLEILIVAVLGLALGSVLMRQLRDLRDGAERIGRGELTHRLTLRGRDELAQTAAQFNQMAERLHATQTTLTEHKANLERIVEERTAEIEAQSKRLEEALETEKSLNALQRQFISMVSHEFRTPLAIVDGKAAQIERKVHRTLEPEAQGYFLNATAVVRRSVWRLVELMESVLMSARLDDGRISFSPERVDLAELLRDMHLTLSAHYTRRDMRLDLDPALNEARIDPVLIRHVVSNLISNAAKYSDDDAEIVLSASLAGPDVRISVRDTGVGVPQDELDKLFDRFFRASTGNGRPGTGIGLHLVQQFVAMHGGRVEVESALDIGSTFHVILPDAVLSIAACDAPVEAVA